MAAALEALKDTPLPTIFVLAGILFWLLAVAGTLAGKITVEPAKQWTAGLLGAALIAIGLTIYAIPVEHSTPVPPEKPTAQSSPGPSPTTEPSSTEVGAKEKQQRADSVKLVAMAPRTDAILSGAHGGQIHIEFAYVLNSADQAYLSAYLEQYSESNAKCAGPEHRTNGGAHMLATRGEHYASLDLPWPGAPGSGFLAVGANYFRSVEGHSTELLTGLGTFNGICYRFEP